MAIELVTSENRNEYMEKKMAEKAGKKPVEVEKEEIVKVKPKKMMDDQFERAMKHPRFAKLKLALGKKGAIDAILKEMNEKQ